MAETQPSSSSQPSGRPTHWCHICNYHVSVENASPDLPNVVCRSCGEGFVEEDEYESTSSSSSSSPPPPQPLSSSSDESSPSFSSSLPPPRRLSTPPQDSSAFDSSHVQFLRPAARKRPSPDPTTDLLPLSPSEGNGDDDDDDFHPIESDGGDNEADGRDEGYGSASSFLSYDPSSLSSDGVYDPSSFSSDGGYNPSDSSDGGEDEADGGDAAFFDLVSRLSTMVIAEDLMCVICRETMRAGEEVKKLPCNHVYHENCIIPWLRQGNSCPIGRCSLDDAEHEQGQETRPESEYDDESASSFSSSEPSSVTSEEDEAGYFDEMESDRGRDGEHQPQNDEVLGRPKVVIEED